VVTRPRALSLDSDSLQALNLSPPVAPEILAGRTQLHLGNWRKITSDQWVLEVIQGYKLELTSLPEKLHIPLSEIDRISTGLISEEVQAMLYKGAICRVPRRGFNRKDGKFRPVVNLRPLNRCILYRNFRMEGIHIVRDLLRRGDYMTRIDLRIDVVFSCPCPLSALEVPAIRMEGSNL